MSQQSNLQGLFERPTTLPDPDAQGRLARLVGMDDKIKRLANVFDVYADSRGAAVLARLRGTATVTTETHPSAPAEAKA